MDAIRPIKTDADHAAAVAAVGQLWGAEDGTDAGDRLDVLATLIDAYERERWPVAALDPVEALQILITDFGCSQGELAEILGSRSRASEVLRRKRPLTLDMIQKIHMAWNVPLDILVRPYPLVPAVTARRDRLVPKAAVKAKSAKSSRVA